LKRTHVACLDLLKSSMQSEVKSRLAERLSELLSLPGSTEILTAVGSPYPTRKCSWSDLSLEELSVLVYRLEQACEKERAALPALPRFEFDEVRHHTAFIGAEQDVVDEEKDLIIRLSRNAT
jgi:hypothetical protein